MQFADKINTIVKLESDINAIASNVRELSADKADMQKKVDALYAECLAEMQENGVVTDRVDMLEIVRRKNPATVDVTDISAVPDEFIRIKKEPDKIKIKDAVMKGLQANWLVVNEGKESITIKGVA